MEQEGDLALQPDFQRNVVWDDGKCSRLIESILLGVPLPIVYVAEDDDGTFAVIDGQQRLTAIVQYLKNDYALRGLRVLTELKNKRFQHLDKAQQKAVKSGVVRATIIKKESDPSIRFEIFERLNTGAVALNAQELRNCVYRGPFNDMLKRLEDHPDWLRLLRLDEPDKRMWTRELILRFLALHDRYNHYGSSMRSFLNAEIEDRRDAKPEQIQAYEVLFAKVVRMALSVFGDHAFERFALGTEEDQNGHWEGKINLALFDAVMFAFAQYEERDVIPRAETIAEAVLRLMTTNQDFIKAITYSTSRKEALRTRVTLWETELRKVCKQDTSQPRCFPYAVRKQLYDQDPTCQLCGGRIVLFDDAVIDHDVPWSKGGPTTLGNANLAHRYCNLAKSDRTPEDTARRK